MAQFVNCLNVFSRNIVMKVTDLANERNLNIRIAEDINGHYGVQVTSHDNKKVELFKTFDLFLSVYFK